MKSHFQVDVQRAVLYLYFAAQANQSLAQVRVYTQPRLSTTSLKYKGTVAGGGIRGAVGLGLGYMSGVQADPATRPQVRGGQVLFSRLDG